MSEPVPTPTFLSETSSLFNPAFCALALSKACDGYKSRSGDALPVTYAFLILPSALHKPTREALPATIRSSMWLWLRDNPTILIDFANRVRAFQKFTGAAVTYGIQHTVLKGSPGSISAGKLVRRPRSLLPTQDWTDCMNAAEFLGRWFASTHADEATTLAHWGVKP